MQGKSIKMFTRTSKCTMNLQMQEMYNVYKLLHDLQKVQHLCTVVYLLQ